MTYSEHWGPPGQAAAVLGVHPNQEVLDLQAALLAAVTPFTGTGGTDAAFVTDPGQQISDTTKDWVETYNPNQVGPNYTAHLTVGLATVADLKAMQAEPFDEFDVQPVGLAVFQLGNNGTAHRPTQSLATVLTIPDQPPVNQEVFSRFVTVETATPAEGTGLLWAAGSR